jgi:hypothetical protein
MVEYIRNGLPDLENPAKVLGIARYVAPFERCLCFLFRFHFKKLQQMTEDISLMASE